MVIPLWRSLLFVPADAGNLVGKSHSRGANAIILDLEDGVAAGEKSEARAGLAVAATMLSQRNMAIVVRVNSSWRELSEDLNVAIRPEVSMLMVPKVEDAAKLRVLSEIVEEFELAARLPTQSIGFIALIESPAGLDALSQIAAVPRVAGLALGSEDFALCFKTPPSEDILLHLNRLIALAAARRRLMALAIPYSITRYDDLDAYAFGCRRARALGATGAVCIHPKQTAVINEEFSPSASGNAGGARDRRCVDCRIERWPFYDCNRRPHD